MAFGNIFDSCIARGAACNPRTTAGASAVPPCDAGLWADAVSTSRCRGRCSAVRKIGARDGKVEVVMDKQQVNPWSWQDQFGFSQAWRVDGAASVVFVSGQGALSADGAIVGAGDF